MATIILKGTDRKIETTIEKCNKINELKKQKADPKTPLEIEGVVVELGDIRYAILDTAKDNELFKEQIGEDSDSYYKKINNNFINEIIDLSHSGIQNKISFNLKIANFYCYTFTGTTLNDWVKVNGDGEIYKLINKELETEKLIASPKIYKNVFKVVDISQGTDNMANNKYLARAAPLRYMERYLSECYKVLKTTV